ncbi:MAG: family 16 glycoside hydrolase [Halieaceae bacterium]|jgi:type 1 glutamine amidotransferase|nr:family 16 glycoside hydrolase [Halieaceae bacterium]
MTNSTKALFSALILVLCCSLQNHAAAQDDQPLRILMITGGGPWHDYETQKDQIEAGLLERLSNIEITTDFEGRDTNTMESTDFFFSRHLQDDWAAEFDVVIYNHCNLQVKDAEYVKGIIAEHVKHQVPAVMLHCPIHLYQYAEGDAADAWWDFTGAVSYVHEKENHPNTAPYTIEVLEPEHPIMKHYPRSWRTPAGELYLIVDLADGVTTLSHAYSVETGSYSETSWVHEYQGVRVFVSSLGHHNVSMGSDVNLNLVASGVLWAAGKLQEDGLPAPGFEGDRGLGWISLVDGTLNGWVESGGVMDWTASSWYGRRVVWPTVDDSTTGKSFRIDGDTLIVEGEQRNLFYDGRIAGGYFRNFEFKVDVYTHPGSTSGIYFHTRYEEDGTPAFGYEAQINASHDGESKTGSLVGASEVDEAAHGDNEWFSYYLKVDGNRVTVKVNDRVVNEFTESANSDGPAGLGRGTIGFQSAGGDSRVYFKNPMIRLLPD